MYNDLIVLYGTLDEWIQDENKPNEYVNKKAKQLNRPICINISLGSNNLAGLEESILYKRNLFEKGIFVCAGVGNDGNLQLHTSGNTPFLGEEKEIAPFRYKRDGIRSACPRCTDRASVRRNGERIICAVKIGKPMICF